MTEPILSRRHTAALQRIADFYVHAESGAELPCFTVDTERKGKPTPMRVSLMSYHQLGGVQRVVCCVYGAQEHTVTKIMPSAAAVLSNLETLSTTGALRPCAKNEDVLVWTAIVEKLHYV